MKTYRKIRHTKDPGEAGLDAADDPEPLGTLWRLRQIADLLQGGHNKRNKAMTTPKTRHLSFPAKANSYRSAAPRHRRFSRIYRAAVRLPREVDPRARWGEVMKNEAVIMLGDAEECVDDTDSGLDL